MISLESTTDRLPQTGGNSLTGLPGREELVTELERRMAEAPGAFALVAIDLDSLKEVNDTEGHLGGDLYIINAADILRSLIRSEGQHPDFLSHGVAEGLATHVSGDEMWAILDGAKTQSEVDAVINRLQKTFDDHGIAASMGGRPHHLGDTRQKLSDDVDALMYENKHTRSLERYDARQLEIIRHIGLLAREHGINTRAISGVLDAIDERDG